MFWLLVERKVLLLIGSFELGAWIVLTWVTLEG